MIILIFGTIAFICGFIYFLIERKNSPYEDLSIFDVVDCSLLVGLLGMLIGVLLWISVTTFFPQNEERRSVQEVDIIKATECAERNDCLMFHYADENRVTKTLESSMDDHTVVEAPEEKEKIIEISRYYNNKHIDYLFGGGLTTYEIHMNREGLE